MGLLVGSYVFVLWLVLTESEIDRKPRLSCGVGITGVYSTMLFRLWLPKNAFQYRIDLEMNKLKQSAHFQDDSCIYQVWWERKRGKQSQRSQQEGTMPCISAAAFSCLQSFSTSITWTFAESAPRVCSY